MTQKYDGPSLFDEPEPEAEDELPDWNEVPQPLFLSWSHSMQMSYCYRRDLDSALRADNDVDAQFFLDRATTYKDLIHG